MALGTVAWGPASIVANTETPTPALTIDAACNQVIGRVDLSPVAAGFFWWVKVQYRKSTGDPWLDRAISGGTTTGAVAHDRQGAVVEDGVEDSRPLPDAGLTGRQVRAICFLGTAATLSGHVTTLA